MPRPSPRQVAKGSLATVLTALAVYLINAFLGGSAPAPLPVVNLPVQGCPVAVPLAPDATATVQP